MSSPHPRATTIHTIAALLLAASTSVHAQQHAHTHGRLALDVAVDTQSITLQMEVPLDNLLGFERAPRSDAERRQVADMVARLKAADTLFRPDPGAGCSLSRVTLDSAVLAIGDGAAEPAATAGEQHADIDVEIVFTCARAGDARFIDVKLFDAFKRIRAIDAQLASGQGQFKRSLSKKAPRLSWGR